MDTLPIINRTYDLYKHVAGITSHMEKRWRYSIGQSIEQSVLDCLSELIMAKNAPKQLKAGYLIRASAHGETQIFQAQSALQEIGRMLGGWLKSVNAP